MKTAAASFALASLVAFPVLTGACSIGDDPNAASDDQAISATARAYVTLRRDTRKCAAPKCGGWFVKDVNRKNPTERYVASLDFTNANLDDASISAVEDAPDGEVVVRAKLGPADAAGTRALLVWEAYRGMPGFGPATGDTFYAVAERKPQINCFTAPCDELTSAKLNSTAKTNFTRVEIEMQNRLQTSWLENRAEADGALVAGSIGNGDHFPGGYEHVLRANQVFLRLPETEGPCPAQPVMQCPNGKVQTFTRSEDRCLVADACVTPGICPQYVPSCGDGYTLVAYAAEPNACPSFTCDPAWLDPQ